MFPRKSKANKAAGLTYAEFVKRPSAKLYLPTYRPATRERYEALHRQRVLRFFGTMQLEEITTASFRAFATELHLASVQTKGPISLVRTVLRAAHESGFIDEVPLCPRGLVATSRKIPDAPTARGLEHDGHLVGWLGVAVALGHSPGSAWERFGRSKCRTWTSGGTGYLGNWWATVPAVRDLRGVYPLVPKK